MANFGSACELMLTTITDLARSNHSHIVLGRATTLENNIDLLIPREILMQPSSFDIERIVSY
jgi:hypothetical protein